MQSSVIITMRVEPAGVLLSATVDGRPNAAYARMPAERVPGEVQLLCSEILTELRDESVLPAMAGGV